MEAVLTGISVASTLCAIVFGYTVFKRNRKKDDSEEGAQGAVIVSELGYIKSSVDDIKRKQERTDEKGAAQHLEAITRITAVEAAVKQAHKRLDNITSESA